MNEPMAKQLPHVWHRPTGEIDDPWAWLVNRDDPDTLAYLDAENCYAEAWFGDRQAMVDEIFDEIRGRIAEDDISAPTPTGEWWYSARTIEGQSYPIYGRGRSADTADTHVIVDLNAEAVGHDYCALGALDPSPDHRLIAWSIDISGDERYTLRVRDAASGIDRDDTIPGTSRGGVAWSADARFVFYVIADDQDRPYQVMRHELGTAVTDDVVVYVEDDERFFVGIGATRSNAWIVIHSGSKTSSEVRLIPTDDPTSDARVVLERQDDHDYSIDDWGDRFVIVTNRDGVDFGVMTAPSDHPDQWSELVPPRAGQRVVGIEPFADYLAVHEWVDAQPQIRIITRDGAERVLDIDPEPHDLDIGSNEIWDTTTLRLVHQSLTQPARVIDVDVTTGDYEVVKTTPTPNIDLDNYVASRHQATAPDGTLVPVDLVHHVDTPLDGTAPVCVYVYGSYEASLPPWFSAARLSLLDRGWVWALAHPRGGGELGRQWYLDGKLLAKRNTFTDTLAVSDSLTRSGLVAPDRVTIRGASAGGLAVGACITMEPQRFAAAVAEVPFVDVTTTMSDPTLPLVVTEWEEWGDPRSEPYASYIESYCPYDNTVATAYPALLVTAGLNDVRVSVHEPAKWVAKLRALRTNRAPLLLRTEMGAGHGGPSGRYDAWRDEARVLTFLIETAGVRS